VTRTSGAGNSSGAHNTVTRAKEDLARRLETSVDDVEVLEFREVVWRDASLGCPQPGMAYAQVLIDGMRIRLRHGGDVYEYHSGGNRGLYLCKQRSDEK
jgi:hypothetical protein